MRRAVNTSIIFALLLQQWSSRVMAASAESDGATAASQAATPSELQAGPCDEARVIFIEGERLYEAGDLGGALRKFEVCQALCGNAEVLFDMALVHQQLGDCPNALKHYRRYIEAATDDKGDAYARQQIGELSKQCPIDDAERPPATAKAQRHEPKISGNSARTPEMVASGHHLWSTIGWVALGAGAIAGGGVSYCSVDMLHVKRDAEQIGISPAEYDNLDRAYYRDSVCIGVLSAVAGIAVGLGVYSLGVAAPSERPATISWSARMSPNTTFVAYRMAF